MTMSLNRFPLDMLEALYNVNRGCVDSSARKSGRDADFRFCSGNGS